MRPNSKPNTPRPTPRQAEYPFAQDQTAVAASMVAAKPMKDAGTMASIFNVAAAARPPMRMTKLSNTRANAVVSLGKPFVRDEAFISFPFILGTGVPCGSPSFHQVYPCKNENRTGHC